LSRNAFSHDNSERLWFPTERVAELKQARPQRSFVNRGNLIFRRDLLKLSPLAIASAAAGRVALAQAREPFATEGLYNVRRYGATGDGKTVDTPAINRAIEAVAAAGGGTLLFPAGTYVCFTIRLRSRVALCLSQGCTVLARVRPCRTRAAVGELSGLRPQPLEQLAVCRRRHQRLLDLWPWLDSR
jgi:hypothetical protein